MQTFHIYRYIRLGPFQVLCRRGKRFPFKNHFSVLEGGLLFAQRHRIRLQIISQICQSNAYFLLIDKNNVIRTHTHTTVYGIATLLILGRKIVLLCPKMNAIDEHFPNFFLCLSLSHFLVSTFLFVNRFPLIQSFAM